MQPSLLLYYSNIVQYTLSHLKNTKEVKPTFFRYPNFRLPTHTYHRFELSVALCGDWCPSLLGPNCCLFHHSCILGIEKYLPLYWTTPASFLCLIAFSQPRGVVANPYHLGETPDLELVPITCLLFICPHRG